MLGPLRDFVRDEPALRAPVLWGMSRFRSLADAERGLYTLCYHSVPAAAQGSFAEQIRFLRRHGDVIDADAAAERCAAGWPSRDRAFLLTFDDGYADTVDVAMPVLRAEGAPAIVFLVSAWIDAPPAGAGLPAYMTRADVLAWCETGFQVGSHTHTHRRLSTLDEASVRAELADSRAALSALVGRPVDHFACPWGVAGADFDADRTPALAAECGYRTFFTTRRDRARSADDLLLMPRHVAEPQWKTYAFDALLRRRSHARR